MYSSIEKRKIQHKNSNVNSIFENFRTRNTFFLMNMFCYENQHLRRENITKKIY